MQNRARNPAMTGGYSQQGYHAPRPPTSWGQPGAPPVQQPGYGYMPPGTYPGPAPPYNMSHSSYGGYPPSWDSTSNQPSQQAAPGTGYDYYNQQSQQQQQPLGGSTTSSTGYNYGQPLPNYSNQASYGDAAYPQTSAGQQSYVQDGYSSGYNATGLQPGYSQTTNAQSGYDQQGYSSSLSYGAVTAPSQDGSASAYGAPSGSTQAPPAQQPPLGQLPNNTTGSYPSQAAAPSGYGISPTSQQGYGSQPPAPTGYGQAAPPNYGQPQSQAPPSQSPYGQAQATSTPASYMQPAPVQPGYGQSPVSQSAYGQQQSYSVPPHSQPSYGSQQQPPFSNSYAGGGSSQPPSYSSDNAAHGTYDTSTAAASSAPGGAPATNAHAT